ncbi:MAG: MBL fold metallo-hydrolase [Phocaeicola sp.]
MNIIFFSIGSGSSGNAYYVGTSEGGILVDAGVGIRTLKRSLKERGISLEAIQAVFVTHDHADHIKAVGHLGEKYHIPIYATQEVHGGITRNYCVTEKLTEAHTCYVEKEQPLQLGAFTITPFEVPHDGTDNVGYCIEVGGRVFSFLTDLGEITETAAHYIRKAHYLIIEANYDDEMLRMGSYPLYLKDRIRGRNGHMSNHETAQFLAENYELHLKYIFLCHLSKDNNHPELAYKTVEYALRCKGIVVGKEVHLVALKRTMPSVVYHF